VPERFAFGRDNINLDLLIFQLGQQSGITYNGNPSPNQVAEPIVWQLRARLEFGIEAIARQRDLSHFVLR